MTMQYKVWIEVEEIDEAQDHYQNLDLPFAELATFDSRDTAMSFAAATQRRVPLRQVLQLHLIHGRHDPKADMDGWGFDGEPIQGINFLHVTYLSTLTIGFVDQAAYEKAERQTGWRSFDDLTLEVERHDDLIKVRDCYYGDFELAAGS